MQYALSLCQIDLRSFGANLWITFQLHSQNALMAYWTNHNVLRSFSKITARSVCLYYLPCPVADAIYLTSPAGENVTVGQFIPSSSDYVMIASASREFL